MKKKNDKAFMSLIWNKYDLENESVVSEEGEKFAIKYNLKFI